MIPAMGVKFFLLQCNSPGLAEDERRSSFHGVI